MAYLTEISNQNVEIFFKFNQTHYFARPVEIEENNLLDSTKK